MSIATGKVHIGEKASFLPSPLIVLTATVTILTFFLSTTLTVPIGPMYWDLFIYFDAAHRIFDGQVPVVDFFVPVGPLGYYLFAGALKIFPQGQPLLLASWSMLAVTAPLMGAVLWNVGRRSQATALAILVPFLVFSVLPFNTREFFPYPGSDGFGIYNRQICQILYVLVAAITFVPSQRRLAVIVTLTMTALFFTKITGFVAGFMLCGFAFCAGRLSLRHAVAAALSFFACLIVLEAWDGMVSHYAADILALVEKNSDTLLPRFLRAGAYTFGIVAPAGILASVLLWTTRGRIAEQWRDVCDAPSFARLARLLDHQGLWLAVVVFAGIFFETQNTGSQALIFIWPVIISVTISRAARMTAAPAEFAVIVLLSCAAAFPPLVHIVERAARTYASALLNDRFSSENLKALGTINVKPEIAEHADDLIRLYAKHRDTYRDFVDTDALPAYMYYLGYDFQLVHLMAIDRAVADIRRLEERKDIRFDSMMELNFVDPFPYLMDRQAPKYVAIGADPTRAVPPPGSLEENAVRDTDLVLYPTCPLTTDNRDLYRLYAPALRDHIKIRLDDCFDAYVNPRFAAKFE